MKDSIWVFERGSHFVTLAGRELLCRITGLKLFTDLLHLLRKGAMITGDGHRAFLIIVSSQL